MDARPKRRVISHSEVDSFNQCKKKHQFAHEDKLTAKVHSDGLSIGSTGHLFFETFFKALLDGSPTEAAKDKAMHAIALDDNAAKVLNLVIPWVDGIFPDLGWKIVAVEQEYRVTISESLVYAFKIDLLVQRNGELFLVDHKFLYDPYSPVVISILPQLPLYVAALRMHGLNIKDGLYNMIRTRETKIDKYLLSPVGITNTRAQQAMLEQIQTMKEIESFPADRIRVHTANKMNCSNCQFKDLCAAELRGENTSLMRSTLFQPNTYGYTDGE
jgi:CRISPR/Cas system-associated exonuclease Cas4 (RecB family)